MGGGAERRLKEGKRGRGIGGQRSRGVREGGNRVEEIEGQETEGRLATRQRERGGRKEGKRGRAKGGERRRARGQKGKEVESHR